MNTPRITTTAPARITRRPLTQTTSRDAYRLKAGSLAARILDHLAQSGGACDFELERALGATHQGISGDRRNLVRRGLVYASVEKRLTPSGALAIVWRAGKFPDTFHPAEVPPARGPNAPVGQGELAAVRS